MPLPELEPRATVLRRVDAVDDAEWASLLASDPRAHAAQRPAFQRRLCGERARWIELRDAEGRLRAGMPYLETTKGPLRTRVSGVGGTYGGPVAAPEDGTAEGMLAAACTQPSWRDAHLEIVWNGEVPPRGEWAGLRPLPTAELPVDPEAEFEEFLRDVFGRKGRKECNRSERRGLRVTRESNAAAWAEFATVLRERGAEWGVHLPEPAIVESLVDEHPEVALFVVRDEAGSVRGAHIAIEMPDELFAWIGTTARIDGANPATLLLREEARHAHALGARRVNLGSSLGLDGVRRYKEMLGARESRRWIVRWRPWWRGGGA